MGALILTTLSGEEIIVDLSMCSGYSIIEQPYGFGVALQGFHLSETLVELKSISWQEMGVYFENAPITAQSFGGHTHIIVPLIGGAELWR